MKLRGVLKKLKVKKKSAPNGIAADEPLSASYALGEEAEAEISAPETFKTMESNGLSNVSNTMDLHHSMQRTRSQPQLNIIHQPNSTRDDEHANQCNRMQSDLQQPPIANSHEASHEETPMMRSQSSPKINKYDEIVCCEEFQEDFRIVQKGFLPDDGSWASFGHDDFFTKTEHSTATATTLASSSEDSSPSSIEREEKRNEDQPSPSPSPATSSSSKQEHRSDMMRVPNPESPHFGTPPTSSSLRDAPPSPPPFGRRSSASSILPPPEFSGEASKVPVEASSQQDENEEEEVVILSAPTRLQDSHVDEDAATSANTPPRPDPASSPPTFLLPPNPFTTSATTGSALSTSIAQSSKATTISGSIGGHESDVSTTLIGEFSFDSSEGSFSDFSRSCNDTLSQPDSRDYTMDLEEGISFLSEDFTDFTPELGKSKRNRFSRTIQDMLFGMFDYVCPVVMDGEGGIYDG